MLLAFLLVFVGVVSVFGFFGFELWTPIKRTYDDEYRKRWLKRVKNELYGSGSASTVDFRNLPGSHIDEVNWAIKLYFDLYEFEKDLIFSDRKIEKGLRTYEVCEIRFKHAESHILKIS